MLKTLTSDEFPIYVRPYTTFSDKQLAAAIREERRNGNCLCYGDDLEHESLCDGCLFELVARRLESLGG